MNKISDRTIYCQTHLADVTLTGARTEEQETNINILPHEKTFSIETSNPTMFKRLVKRTLANPEEWRLTQVWAPADYPINQCSVACFTAPISCITLRTFSPSDAQSLQSACAHYRLSAQTNCQNTVYPPQNHPYNRRYAPRTHICTPTPQNAL